MHRAHPLLRATGTWEYGIRDLDVVCVPVAPLDSYAAYVKECEKVIGWFDKFLTSDLAHAPPLKWWEITQSSSDFSIMSRRQLLQTNMQKIFKTNEYGCIYVWHLDSH
jgi:hypothetical protein